jgi:hypothetical protein
MDFDDLVIGSGLAALGATLGLLTHPQRRIGVLCGPSDAQFLYYDARRTVPCAYLGPGGLGSHWHGVIPMGWRHNFSASSNASFSALFQRFYPRASVQLHLGRPELFVPWRAIRPAPALHALATAQPQRLSCITQPALTVRMDDHGGVSVTTPGPTLRAHRVWVAAGALHTPPLLARTWGANVQRGLASDHAFCYVGQVAGATQPRIVYSRDGLFFPARYNVDDLNIDHSALYTLRPAAFAFKRLDFGIEQRAVFGLPTGHAIAKLTRRLSPGLLVEAFYNRFGLFGGTSTHSVYAQVPVVDAYEIDLEQAATPLRTRSAHIRRATDEARANAPHAGLRHSQRPELHLPGIHLHHTLDLAALAACGVNTGSSPVQVVDASALSHIGPDHHSFKMMLAAYERAQASS